MSEAAWDRLPEDGWPEAAWDRLPDVAWDRPPEDGWPGVAWERLDTGPSGEEGGITGGEWTPRERTYWATVRGAAMLTPHAAAALSSASEKAAAVVGGSGWLRWGWAAVSKRMQHGRWR